MGQGSSKSFGPGQRETISEAFNFIDTNQDGQIDQTEISSLMERLGVEVSEADILKKLQEYDKNKSGTISFKEFLPLMKDTLTDVNDER